MCNQIRKIVVVYNLMVRLLGKCADANSICGIVLFNLLFPFTGNSKMSVLSQTMHDVAVMAFFSSMKNEVACLCHYIKTARWSVVVYGYLSTLFWCIIDLLFWAMIPDTGSI